MLRIFVNRVSNVVLFHFLIDLLGVRLKILKICVLPVVQLYVEMFE